ncbi:MAG: cytochrome b [Rhodospirillaceae bacterium]|nr:cytochrome b [Rhodospirillaceae bacterium]
MSQPNDTSYGLPAQALHWLMAVLLAAQYAVGELMPHISGRTPNQGLVAWHIVLGGVILGALLVQAVWRVTHPVRQLDTLPAWQQKLARAAHAGLYALTAAITLLGWAAASFRGWDVPLFGLLALPALAAKGTPWAHTAGDVHVVLVYVLAGVIALHVAAALYHHFGLRDRVLTRMLPLAKG